MKAIIKKTPVPVAGLALGLVALGKLLAPLSPVLLWVFTALSCCILGVLLARIIFHPRLVKGDFRNSIFASVFGTFFMTIMQLASVLAGVAWWPAFILWAAAILAHLCWIVVFTRKFFVQDFHLSDVFPTYFICYVGIIVGSTTAPVFGMQTAGMILFWVGFACFVVLLILVTWRYIEHSRPEPAKPLVCIYAAPFSLSLTGYLSCAQEPSIPFALTLAVAAQIMLVVVLFQLPHLLKLRFYPSYAAMTFPFVITATALGKLLDLLALQGWQIMPWWSWLYGAETAFATFMVCYVFVRYLGFFRDLRASERSHDDFIDLEKQNEQPNPMERFQ